ncbi:hypothetical protein ACFOET_18195 [Parapedobacter deserti]|uniref:Uncharacterized protein n=1 Tax=Parapedobacter deserti TaxID=1912957 RepID=A0ABV7JTF8_9SPHI
MELDEMKKLWQTQHANSVASNEKGECPTTRCKKGQARVSIAYPGEQDAERVASEKSNGYLTTILRNEYTGLSLVIILLVALLSLTDRALSSVTAMAGYIILLLSLLAKICTAVYKIVLIKRIDLAADSLTDFALKMDRFHLLVAKERLVGLSSIPFGLVSLYLLIDGYRFQQLIDILPRLIISIVLAIAISYFMYKKSYFDKIKDIKEHIKAVKHFRDSA